MNTILKEWYQKEGKTTLKDCSYDDANKEYMTQSGILAVDFDTTKDNYCNGNLNGVKSNDSFYFNSTTNRFYFIEFKNGCLLNNKRSEDFKKSSELKEKIYDSALILEKVVLSGHFQTPLPIDYILVYNEVKNKIGNTSSKKHMSKISNIKPIRFNLAKFNGFLFGTVETLTQAEFENKIISEAWA